MKHASYLMTVGELITARGRSRLEAHGRRAPCFDAHLTKPVKAGTLQQLLNELDKFKQRSIDTLKGP